MKIVQNRFLKSTEFLQNSMEPGWQNLCDREQWKQKRFQYMRESQ
jgi:hypothetical protein